MPLLKTDLPEIVGEYGGVELRLVKQPLPGARIVRGREYPIAVSIKSTPKNNEVVTTKELSQFFSDLGKSQVLQRLITTHGLVIIQDLNSTDPEHYSLIVNNLFDAQNYEEFDQVGLLAKRKKIEAAVSSVGNDDELGKNVNKLNAHQEFSRYLDFPHVLTFFASRAPRLAGGESTTTHATELFDRVNEKYPEFVRDLYEKGGNHVHQRFSYQVSDSSNFKISWTDEGAFGRYITKEQIDDENVDAMKENALKLAHEKVSKHVEFDENNDLILHQINDIALVHPFTNEPVIFSSLPTYYGGYYKSKFGLLPEGAKPSSHPPLTYGNGEKIPEHYLDYLFEQSVELEYTHRFQDGDLLLLDNYSVYHGRNPYTAGDRVILASFWDQKSKVKKRPYKPEKFLDLLT